jgi:hypothetical protein
VAEFIPRAKSTSIRIEFSASGGKLRDVEAMEFQKAARPEVDLKNFRSELFVLHIDELPPGGDTTVSLQSDFFTSATEFYVFNPNQEPSWNKNAGVKNIPLPDLVQKLEVRVVDGSALDSDGSVDGKVTLIGGPRDSFWGYAIGTLFIRFFGIFIVLGILMIGMMVSGLIFRSMETRKTQTMKEPPKTREAPVNREDFEPQPSDPKMALAIAVALHLHLQPALSSPPQGVSMDSSQSNWSQQGRQFMMGERMVVFNRSQGQRSK